MGCKKLLLVSLLALLGVCTITTTQARVPSIYPVPPTLNRSSYFEGRFGMFQRNLATDDQWGKKLTVGNQGGWERGHVGWVAGFDAGYFIVDWLAVEAGWMRTQSQEFDGTYGSTYTIAVDSSITDIVLKLRYRLFDWMGIYAKAGAAWVWKDASYTSTTELTSKSRRWVPIVGVGAGYSFTHNWFATLDCLFVLPSNKGKVSSDNPELIIGAPLPRTLLVTFGVGWLIEF